MDNNHILFETEGIAKSDRVLYTPSEFAKQNLLYVQEAGTLISLSAHKSAHKKLDSYLLLEVIKGSGTVVIEDNKLLLSVGDIVLVDCNKDYYHISDEDNPWTIAWVHFNGYAAAGYFEIIKSYFNDGQIMTDIFVKQLVDVILPLLRVNHLSNELLVSEKLQHALNNILRLAIDNRAKQNEANWNYIREYVNEKCNTNDIEIQHYISEIEQKFHISQDEILEGFENHFGVGLDSYIEFRKLSIVKEKLRFTTQSMEDIALEVGIRDNEAFIELFKKHENVTPAEYRRSWAQWIRG